MTQSPPRAPTLPRRPDAPTVPPQPAASQSPRRWFALAAVGAVVVVALLAFVALRAARATGGQTPTAGATTIAQAVSLPAATRPPGPGLPTAASSSGAQRTTTPGTTPSVVPSATPAPVRVASVEPTAAYAGAGPVQLLVRGTNLDRVRGVRLVAVGRPPIGASITAPGPEQLALQLAPLAEPLNGEVGFLLELDGVLMESPEILLRDFVERRTVAGVLAQYEYTNRVAGDAAGAYTRMRAEPNVGSAPVGQLRNGDVLEVRRNDVDGWYQVRVAASADTAQVGVVGWIERWLVDNQAAPTPAPTPQRLVFVGRVYSAPTDAAVRCGTSFQSSIYGGVENAGRGIAGARVRVTSADGRNSYTVTTARGGIYSVPGLGCTTWTVSLLSVPNAPAGIQANRVVVRNLNGGRYTSAEVRFKLRG